MSAVLRIIEKMELLLQELKATIEVKSARKSMATVRGAKLGTKEKSKFRGVRGAIYELVQEGFFDSPRNISEIQSKLRDEGINKPTTGLMTPLLALIKHKILERRKPEKGLYQYLKRNK